MKLYFRHGEKNVVVFRMEVANRQRRIELNRIARIAPDGTVFPQPNRTPTADELARIGDWWADWQRRSAAGDVDRTEDFMRQINLFTDWMARQERDLDGAELDADADCRTTLREAAGDKKLVIAKTAGRSLNDRNGFSQFSRSTRVGVVASV